MSVFIHRIGPLPTGTAPTTLAFLAPAVERCWPLRPTCPACPAAPGDGVWRRDRGFPCVSQPDRRRTRSSWKLAATLQVRAQPSLTAWPCSAVQHGCLQQPPRKTFRGSKEIDLVLWAFPWPCRCGGEYLDRLEQPAAGRLSTLTGYAATVRLRGPAGGLGSMSSLLLARPAAGSAQGLCLPIYWLTVVSLMAGEACGHRPPLALQRLDQSSAGVSHVATFEFPKPSGGGKFFFNKGTFHIKPVRGVGLACLVLSAFRSNVTDSTSGLMREGVIPVIPLLFWCLIQLDHGTSWFFRWSVRACS